MRTQVDEEMVGRLFDRMGAIYGVQKMSSMWTGVDPAEVRRRWARTLSNYPLAALRMAAESIAEECGPWPPTLTEFVALVRSKMDVPAHRRALPVPKRTDAEIERGAHEMAKIRALLAKAVKRMPE